MGSEVKSKGAVVSTVLSATSKKKFAKYAKSHRTSMAQILRDFVQEVLKDDDECCNNQRDTKGCKCQHNR